MTKHHINKTTQYLHSLLVEQKPWQRKLEQYAKAYRIPIIDRITMNVLTQYVILHQPSRILEIGTAIGYSTLCMHERSEERRVGKECRCGWWRKHYKHK